jgi:hypothetical protein
MQTNNQLIQTKRVWCMTPNKLQQAKLQLNICIQTFGHLGNINDVGTIMGVQQVVGTSLVA